jgi:hypothetical protein
LWNGWILEWRWTLGLVEILIVDYFPESQGRIMENVIVSSGETMSERRTGIGSRAVQFYVFRHTSLIN